MNFTRTLMERFRRKRKLRRLIKEAKALKLKPLVIPPEKDGFGR